MYGARWREERRGRHGQGETVWDSSHGQILSEDRKDEGRRLSTSDWVT